MNPIEQAEYDRLLQEVKAQHLRSPGELSQYIVRYKLGRKYPHISGLVKFKRGEKTWNFEGGFPRHIYAKLCEDLGYYATGDSIDMEFIPYEELRKKVDW